MNDILNLLIVFTTGLILGGLFFGGLWITVKKAITSKKPIIWFLSSFIIRFSILLIGFYTISHRNWQWILVCLLGFIIARIIVFQITKSIEEKQMALKKEEVHHET